MSMRIRKNIEKTLTTDETAMYIFVELSCPYEDKKNNTEHGDSNTSKTIQSVSTVLIGSPRNVFPLK